MLLYFMVDWVRDAEIPQSDDPYTDDPSPRQRIREAFERDPDGTCRTYQILRTDLQALRSLSPQIQALLPSITANFLESFKNEHSLLWPGPVLSISSLSPNLVPRDQPVEIEISVSVDKPHIYDDTAFSVDVVFESALGERVVAVPVLPIALPEVPIAEVTFRCHAVFPTGGAYRGTVTITKMTDPPFAKSAAFDVGRLNVQE